MQESFSVVSSSNSYQVQIGENLLEQVINKHKDSFFIIDSNLKKIVPIKFKNYIFIEATEKNKSLEKIPEIILKMREARLNRTSHVVAIGGGIIQDIVTFAASIYMRGISWTYMPTTLLGMIDSCVGGKSAINILGYKNLIGNFHPPKSISIDVSFLETLNNEQIVCGLYEAVKISYAKDIETFLSYLDCSPKLPLNNSTAQNLISKVLKTKKWFIEIDEFDQKERLILNFGHTFCHALESSTDFAIAHGIAVGMGMIIAIQFSKNENLLNDKGIERTELLKNYIKGIINNYISDLLEKYPKLDLNYVLKNFDNDKKHETNSYRIILPKDDGGLVMINKDKTENARQKIIKAYQEGLKIVGYPNF
jgi:3-dehydroquinate synthase